MPGTTFRIEQIQSAMDGAGIDAVVLRLAENVVLTTDWYVQISGLGLVVIGRSGGASLLVPEYEAEEAAAVWAGDIRTFPAIRNDGPPTGAEIARHLGELAREHGAVGGVVGFEGSFESIAPGSMFGEPNAVGLPTQALYKATFQTEHLVDVSELLESIRSVKTEHDIERLRRTNEIAVFGLNAFKEAAVPGATRDRGARRRRARHHRAGPRLQGRALGARLLHDLLGPGARGGLEVLARRAPGGSRRATSSCSSSARSPTATGRITRARSAPAARARGCRRHTTSCGPRRARASRAAKPGATRRRRRPRRRAPSAPLPGSRSSPTTRATAPASATTSRARSSFPAARTCVQEGNVIITEPGIYSTEIGGGVRFEDDAVVTAEGAVVLATTEYAFDLS